jgi:hypothetical protein
MMLNRKFISIKYFKLEHTLTCNEIDAPNLNIKKYNFLINGVICYYIL